jgi:hypothetical protein
MKYFIVFVNFGGFDLFGKDLVEDGGVRLGFFHGGKCKDMIFD